MQWFRSVVFTITFAALTIGGCGGKKGDAPKTKDDAATGSQVAPLAMPPSGVDKIARMNFVYGDGWPAYDKAIAAKAKKDWTAARALAEASIAKDPYHLDAHRLLATVLAQAGEHAAVVDHLVTALADDYWRYGPSLAKDDDLQEFLATPHGQSILALAQKIHDDYAKRIATGVWLVGRRSSFKWPKDLGVQAVTTRGELYAFDRETRRYLRLTHTDHRVAGFVRAPGGGEVAIVGFDKVDRPKTPPDAPPTFDKAWVLVFDTTEWKPMGPKIALAPAREIALGYAAGDQLLVVTDGNVASIDKASSKTTKVTTAAPVPRITLTLDEGRVIRTTEGVTAAWTGEPATAPTLAAGGAPIQIPESGVAAQASVALAPGGAHLVFATAVDACAKDLAPSLYVADTKKGTIKHLLTAKSRFPTRWIDPTTLAYEDGEGAIRLWDAATGREVQKLDNKVGIALDVLSLAPAPLCKAAPPTVDAGSGSADEPLPPEEGSGGPVTTPP
ncbi:MAG: hypothetical protein IPQ07_02910 [Myxococcales bacterium]|nr:hypothetical protein [Myxococcales bacterium]